MDSKYIHANFEGEIYKLWERSGGFGPNDDPKAKPFCIIMPPPNANDPLHVGHAMFVAIEDILTRYHRMKGDAALWLPGTDHAGIETQFVFEKKLKKEGKSRFDFDRETLYQMIWDYVQENSGVAVDQMKKLGASADWSRFKFTLDKDVVEMVLDTFIQLNKDGLIYRGERLVNYCTSCGTGYSDLEVEHEDRNSPLYYMKYGPFTLATVRPETKFGDSGIAVNPKDKRYKEWIGKEVEVEGLVGKFKLRVVGDLAVDPEFGTGVVKVTPAHDFTDFEIGQRHGLEMRQVIGLDGKLTEIAGKYAGLKVEEARKVIVEDMKTKGLIEKVDEKYMNRVATCYRCHRTIEPMPLKQFFIKVEPLAKKALAALDSGETKILGAGREKILRHWLTNLKDWNISRQIVWGIRLPVWYKRDNKEEWVASKMSPGKEYVQDTDTFDTWFSSGQWPYVTLLAQRTNEKLRMENGKLLNDFERFYPTQVMETAYEILPFWVMRMMMLGIYLTGKSPFTHVYLHGLIRDEKGRKMSKSIGNVINPLTIVEQYGADALRMALVIRSTPGLDKGVGDGDFRAARNLTNKIWNSARYVISRISNQTPSSNDKKFYEHLGGVVKNVTKQLDDLRVGLAAETVYNEFWHWFCDECIEKNKREEISAKALIEGLVVFLKLLHPFVPFVTEAVWQELRQEGLLMNNRWPSV